MGKQQLKTGRAGSIPAGLAFGVCISLGILLVSSAILVYLVDTGSMAWEKIGYGIMGSLLLAAFGGAWSACKRIKRQYLLVSVMSGTVFLGMLMTITALFFGGKYEAIGVTALLILGASTASGLLLVQSSNRRSGKIRKYPYR